MRLKAMDRYNIHEVQYKLIERARAQARIDYADEDYPASACVVGSNLDFVINY